MTNNNNDSDLPIATLIIAKCRTMARLKAWLTVVWVIGAGYKLAARYG